MSALASTGTRPRIVVVGAGIAGLAAAYRLTQVLPAASITLIEAEHRLGGKIVTERVEGFLIEGGPDSFLATKPRGLGLCQELGFEDELIGPIPRPRRAYVKRRGRLHEIPEGLSGLVPTRLGPLYRSALLTPLGKARVALDLLLPARSGDDDEPLASFVRRRLGAEAYDWLIEPLMAGIYAADGERLSLAATFPQLREGERRHGSLTRGVLASKRAAPGRSPFLTPRFGLGSLVEALRQRIRAAEVQILLGKPGSAVTPGLDRRYSVERTKADSLAADAVVLATPAHATAEMLREIDPTIANELAGIPYASSAIVTLAFRESDLQRPLDAHGYVVPRAEGGPILACTWSSAKWDDRAPSGFILVRLFIGRFGQEESLVRSDADLIALACAEVRHSLAITAETVIARVSRWRWAMPQYVLGHTERLARIDRQLTSHPGLALAGAAYRGVGLPDCIASGETAAEAVAEAIRLQPRRVEAPSH